MTKGYGISASDRRNAQLTQVHHDSHAPGTSTGGSRLKQASPKQLGHRSKGISGPRKKAGPMKPTEYWEKLLKPELQKNGKVIKTRRAGFFKLHGADPSIITTQKVETVAKMVVDRTPVLKESGRARPNWDTVWDGIRPGHNEHRRHIVMSSPMRSATYKMCDLAKQMPQDACNAFFARIQKIVTDHASLTGAPVSPGAAKGLGVEAELEGQLVTIMHNHKTNIFLGPGGWNSAIGGLAHLVHESERGSLERLGNANSAAEIHQGLSEWLTALSKAPVFGHNAERGAIVEVYTTMIARVLNDYSLMHELMADPKPDDPAYRSKLAIASDGLGTGSLDDLKEHLSGIILGFSDTMTTDISEAKSGKLRMIQNGYFEFNKLFLIMSTASFDQATPDSFQRDANNFLNTCEAFIKREASDLAAIGVPDAKQLYGLNWNAMKTLEVAAKFQGKGRTT